MLATSSWSSSMEPPIRPLSRGKMVNDGVETDVARGPNNSNNATTAATARETENPFVCNICKKSYTRVDHLARHHRSHTQERPFSCTVCGKDFSRADLLKRHAAGHGEDPARKRSRLDGQKPSRVSQACTACATAKIKCDQEKPCRRCRTRGLECVAADTNNHDSDSQSSRRESVTYPNNHDPETQSIHRESLPYEMAPPIPLQPNVNERLPTTEPVPMVTASPDQLPTPVTFNQTSSQTAGGEQGILEIPDETYLADFLKDIMMPYAAYPNHVTANGHGAGYASGSYTPRDVMDFGVSPTFDLNDYDFASLTSYEGAAVFVPTAMDDVIQQNESAIIDVQSSINMGSAAFRRSVWRWTPTNERGNNEQMNLAGVPADGSEHQKHLPVDGRPPEHHLDQKGRDKILGLILGISDASNFSRIVSSFPSAATLDGFLNQFLQSPEFQQDSWIHLPTFQPNNLRPELISIMVAFGATLSSSTKVQRFGYAMEEAVRLMLPKTFESDNSRTRALETLQAYILQLTISTWSGNKRKMEIAESHTLPLVTMLRRGGQYRRSRKVPLAPGPYEQGPDLEMKWREWVEYESFKRLAFHTFIHTAQVSISLLVPPLISYAEMSLDFPAPRELWEAKSAEEWRDNYLAIFTDAPDHGPSLVQAIYNFTVLEDCKYRMDLEFTIRIVLFGFWSLVWDHRQMSSAVKSQTSIKLWNGPLISSSWHRELCQLLEKFRIIILDWEISLPRESKMILELLSMNLHVSFEELQLLAGKEGEDEARRAYPSLKQWVETQSSREAVWHAGQVLRAAEFNSDSMLQNFYAVALYHAGLAFWVYGIVSRAKEREKQPTNISQAVFVWLNGDDPADRHRFVSSQRSVPVIKHRNYDSQMQSTSIALLDPKAVMDAIIEIMQHLCTNYATIDSPLVANLTQLMRDLGNAAWVIGQ